MIERDLADRLRAAAGQFPAVTLTGPRQSGKSTLCRGLFPGKPYVSVEAPDTRAFAIDDPRGFLAQYPQGAIIAEVQRTPQLPSYLQGIIDAAPAPGRWILTGSQNLALLESVSQSLAGRTAVLHLLPMSWPEVSRFASHPGSLDEAMFAGGYPRIFDKGLDPSDWLRSYVATYIERDVRTVTGVGDLTMFQRFVEICAGRTGQLMNYSALAADCGITQPTAKSWLSVLETSFIAFRLPPFYANITKRLTKMPKFYFSDTGLACWLMGIRSADQLRTHPLRGAIFETWVVSEVMKHRANAGETGSISFYREACGLEADLLVETPRGVLIVEAKAGQTITPEALRGVDEVAAVIEETGKRCERYAVYGGDEPRSARGGRIVPWRAVGDVAWV